MVRHGFETTVPVTLDMMILQGHAVMRPRLQTRAGRGRPDMPFAVEDRACSFSSK
jgi:hypothetical protein